MRWRPHALSGIVIAFFLALAFGSAPPDPEENAPDEPVVVEPTLPEAPTGPPPDPNFFGIPDSTQWAPTELPRAGVRVRIPPDARVTESGRIVGNTPQAGPYVGVVLPGGRDVQIDALDADVEWSRENATSRAAAGELTVLHSQAGELVTQPTGVSGCTISACRRGIAGGQMCAVTGSRAVLGQEGATYPTLRDCGVLIAIVRSLEPL